MKWRCHLTQSRHARGVLGPLSRADHEQELAPETPDVIRMKMSWRVMHCTVHAEVKFCKGCQSSTSYTFAAVINNIIDYNV